MLKHELLEIIINGESSEIEFKRDDLKPEQLAKEIVAFANSYGGKLFVGIEDDGTISGIQRADFEPWVMDSVCGRYVHPSLVPKYEEIQVEEGLRVAVISIPMGSSKPYVVHHNDREDFYIRVGSLSKLATREQIVRMSASGGMLHVETMPVPRTSMKSMDKARLENYFRDILSEPSLPQTEEEWEERLEDMGFLASSSNQKKACTIAGLVLFGINPRRYLKQAGLRIMVFDSSDKQYKALLDIVLDGPMVARVEVTNHRVSGIIDDGLVEKAASALYPFITEESSTIDKGFRRPLKWLYPWNAIRELLLNALAHRDWTRSTDIEISRYKDRLEVISPGALPNSMTVEKMIGGRRTPRNTIIMEVLRDYQYVDARGMGIRTKVIPIMKEFNGMEPVFEETDDYLKTILNFNGPKDEPKRPKYEPNEPKNTPNEPKKNSHEPKNEPNTDLNDIVLNLIKDNPKCSYADMIRVTGKSRITIKRLLDTLKERGVIERVGPRNGGKWVIL
ncbi:MAG: putative DNA binding domain-containing protein [Candidatus Cloacimonadaceae bacterium]|nr:putative DNA binding domain-containing protein [Candidatus Cloacimonadaceae bacterium]